MRRKRNTLIISGIVLICILLFILNLIIGSTTVSLSEFIKVILQDSNDNTLGIIILNYRLPQAITALLAGAALSVAGLLMQTLFRNPLADRSEERRVGKECRS